MRKILSALIVGLCTCALFGVMASAEINPGSPGEMAYRFGRLEKTRIFEGPADSGAPGAEVRVKAESFVITEHELECSIAGYEMLGYDGEKAGEMAVNSLSTQKAVFNEAKKRGYSVDRRVILDRIEEQKKIAPTASNYDVFERFLDGIGMTNEGYWDTQYDTFMRAEIIGRFRQDCMKDFQGTHAADSISAGEFDAYYDRLVEEILEKENVTFVKD